MKLSEINYDLSTPSKVEILNPSTGRSFETPAYIYVYSTESKVGKQVQLNIYRDIMKLKEEKKEEITNEDIRDVTSNHLDLLIANWEGIQDEDGNDMEYSSDKAKEVVKKYEIIYNIVNLESSKMGNFLKK